MLPIGIMDNATSPSPARLALSLSHPMRMRLTGLCILTGKMKMEFGIKYHLILGKCLRGSVDVDQDLMVTVDDTQCGYCYRKNSAHIYKRSGGSWAEAGEVTFDELPDLLNVYQVALSGDTLAVQVFDGCTFYDANESECYINIYKYNREFGTITLEENFIGLPSKCSPMVFDGNYLVHGLSVYHKPGIHDNEHFSLLTIAYPSPASGMVPTGYGKSLALDNGILVQCIIQSDL